VQVEGDSKGSVGPDPTSSSSGVWISLSTLLGAA